MKKALIEKSSDRAVQIVNVGDEFEVHEGGLYWVDCPDDTQTFWRLLPDGSFEDPHAEMRDEFGNLVEPWIMQRMRAYAPTGDQMDMLYKEIRDTGKISVEGVWFRHITDAKNATPKPAVLPPNSTPPA